MSAIKQFFRKVWLLMTDRKAYKKYETTQLGDSMKYLYALLWCTSFVTIIIFSSSWYRYHGAVEEFIMQTKVNIAKAYPEELVVTVSGGILSTNVTEPYIVDPFFLQFILKEPGGNTDDPSHFLTIDTKGSVETYSSYDSLVLVTREAIIAPEKNGSLRIFLLQNTKKPVKIDAALYDTLMKSISPFFERLPLYITIGVILLITVGPFFLAGFSLFGHMLYLVFATLILWAVSGILQRGLTYGQIYRMGMYGLTPPIIITLVLQLLSITIPLLFSLIFFVWMTIVVVTMKPKRGK